MEKKKGLGRGLESLFAFYDNEQVENIATKKTTNEQIKGVDEIELSKITPNPNQPRKRFDESALQELANSIKVHGVIQPLVVNKLDNGNYMIIAGERRWRASKIAGLEKVPVVIKNYTDKQIKEISIRENLQREDLNPIEAARAIKQLMEEYNLKYLVLTAGSRYSTIYSADEKSTINTPKVEVADTVGAGDSFSGAFVCSILSGKSLKEAHQTAVEIAAFVCTKDGAWPVYPTK